MTQGAVRSRYVFDTYSPTVARKCIFKETNKVSPLDFSDRYDRAIKISIEYGPIFAMYASDSERLKSFK